MTTRQFQRLDVILLLTISSNGERARRQSTHGLTAAWAKVTQYYLCDFSHEKSRHGGCARGYVFTVVTCFHPPNWHLPLFLCLLKFLFIKVLKENSFHFNGFSMVLQWAQRQQFLKFKFKFKFIYSHLFNYNTTTIRNKKEEIKKNRANYTSN